MAINGKFVIDAVIHAFDAREELRHLRPEYKYGWMVHESTFAFSRQAIPPPHTLSPEQFFRRMPADAVSHALFVESPTDVGIYHTIPAWGLWPDLSPVDVGLEIAKRYPGRMFLYGAVSPLEGTRALEELERQKEEWKITGVKLYPVDFIDGELRPWRMSDEQVLYPLLELCRRLEIGVVAIHKALPVGVAPTEFFRPDDVDYPARDFPDLTFEIVHGGFAFLEETAFQIGRFENIYVNLEAVSALILRYPGKFARIIGELLLWGGAGKLIWATGCAAFHPAPLVEAFDGFQMPEDLQEQYGYPPLSPEDKEAIFARTIARLHGLDIDAIEAQIAEDELTAERETGGATPWSRLSHSQPSR